MLTYIIIIANMISNCRFVADTGQCLKQIRNENHVIDWDKAKVIDRESDISGRHIREAIWIKKTENMNRDEGSYQLSHVRDKFLHTNNRHQKSVLMKTSDVKLKRR